MAEVLFRQLLEELREADDWSVESAGVWAYQGAPATQNAQVVMAERDLDLSRHLSQPASSTLLKQFDLTMVMEQEHKTVLQDQNPQLADRIYLMREIAGQEGDFADPVGGSLERYRSAADELGMLMRDGIDRIDELVKAPGL